MSNDELTRDALALPLSERVELAQALWESIHERWELAATEDEKDAIAEAKKRDAELASGAVTGRSHEEVMAAAQRTLECR